MIDSFFCAIDFHNFVVASKEAIEAMMNSTNIMSEPVKRRRVSFGAKEEAYIPSGVVRVRSSEVTLKEESQNLSRPQKKTTAAMTVPPVIEEVPKLLLVDLQSNDIRQITCALEKLSILLKECPANKRGKEVFLLGGHATILLTMHRFQGTIKAIHYFGPKCLYFLTLAECNFLPTALAKLGGIEVLLKGMKAFTNSYKVQSWSCFALERILAGLNVNEAPLPGKDSHLERFCFDLGGLAMILNTMTNNRRQKKLQLASCNIILSCDHHLRRYCSEENLGVIALILNVMKTFRDNEEFQLLGCKLLLVVLSCGDAAKDALKKAGVASIVSVATENYPQNDELQQCARKFMMQFFGSAFGL